MDSNIHYLHSTLSMPRAYDHRSISKILLCFIIHWYRDGSLCSSSLLQTPTSVDGWVFFFFCVPIKYD